MSNALPPEILLELQKEYLIGFAEHLTEVKSAWEKKDWKMLEGLFHKFVGSGTTYECPNITVVARALETYLGKTATPDENEVKAGISLFEKVVIDYRKIIVPEYKQTG